MTINGNSTEQINIALLDLENRMKSTSKEAKKAKSYDKDIKKLKEAIAAMQEAAAGDLDKYYPVGTLYWSSKNTDPGTLFGGTWQRIKGCFVYAADNETVYPVNDPGDVNQGTSGSIILNERQLPSHNHSFEWNGYTNYVDLTHNHALNGIWGLNYIKGTTWGSDFVSDGNRGFNYESLDETDNANYGSSWQSLNHCHTVNISTTTGDNGPWTGESINVMPPHKYRYCWERIA